MVESVRFGCTDSMNAIISADEAAICVGLGLIVVGLTVVLYNVVLNIVASLIVFELTFAMSLDCNQCE